MWVTSKLYEEGEVGHTRKMEPSRRLRNVRSIGLLQIDDKIRYYTFIYSFQHYSRLETCMSYFHFDAWNCVHTILLAYDIET